MKPLSIPLLLCSLSLNSACFVPGYGVKRLSRAAVDPLKTPPDLATVCILRPQTFGALAAFEIFDNGRLVGISRGAEVYSCHLARPGWHRIIARSDNDAAVDTRLEAGQRVFLRLEVRLGPDDLSAMDDAEAVAMLPALQYITTFTTSADTCLYLGPTPARDAAAGEGRCAGGPAPSDDRPAPPS